MALMSQVCGKSADENAARRCVDEAQVSRWEVEDCEKPWIRKRAFIPQPPGYGK